VQSTLASLSHVHLALYQCIHHAGHLLQSAQYNLVAFYKGITVILDTRLFAKLLDQSLHGTKVMSWHAGEEMVYGLKLQATMEPIQPFGAVNIHSRTQLTLGKGFSWAQVSGRHSPVGERDLNVEDNGEAVGNEYEEDARGPVWKSLPNDCIAENGPIAAHECDLNPTRAKT